MRWWRPIFLDPRKVFFFVDILCVAQNRPEQDIHCLATEAVGYNQADVEQFERYPHVERFVLVPTPIDKPRR